MPVRSPIPVTGDASSLRAVIVEPDDKSSAPRPAALIHRGLSHSEADGEFLERLADALAEANIVTIAFEPRTSQLILEDFHAFTLEQSIADLQSMIAFCRSLKQVDPARLALIGWSFGSISAIQATQAPDTVNCLCLINPATPEFIVSSTAQDSDSSDDQAAFDPLPRAVIDRLTDLQESKSQPTPCAPALIIHAAADRLIAAEVSEQYQGGGPSGSEIQRLLIARADHTFSNPAARRACFDCVVGYLSAMTPRTPAALPSRSGS